MTNCTDCRELESQLEEASVEYLLVASTHGPKMNLAKRPNAIKTSFRNASANTWRRTEQRCAHLAYSHSPAVCFR